MMVQDLKESAIIEKKNLSSENANTENIENMLNEIKEVEELEKAEQKDLPLEK